MNKLTAMIGATLLLSIVACPCLAAETDWQCELKVQSGFSENRLLFGQAAGATDNYDGRFDVPAMLSGGVKAYFNGSESKKLWRDTRALVTEGPVWVLKVEASSQADEMVLRWTEAGLPAGKSVTLHDLETGTAIDMHAEQSYRMKNGGIRTLQIQVKQ